MRYQFADSMIDQIAIKHNKFGHVIEHGLKTAVILQDKPYPYSAVIDFNRQNLTSVDVRF